MGGCQNYGYHFGGAYNKDYSILGSIYWGTFILGNCHIRLRVEGFGFRESL